MVTPVRPTFTAAVVSSARIDSDDLLVDALRGTRYDLLTSPASETSSNSLNASLDRIAGHATSPSMATPSQCVTRCLLEQLRNASAHGAGAERSASKFDAVAAQGHAPTVATGQSYAEPCSAFTRGQLELFSRNEG